MDRTYNRLAIHIQQTTRLTRRLDVASCMSVLSGYTPERTPLGSTDTQDMAAK